MSSINRCLLVGRLVRDPELRHTQGGTAVCEFSLAVNSREKQADGEWGDRVDFFDVTVWSGQGEACAQYLSKGSQCAVDGRLRQDRWEAKDGGGKRSKVVIVASNVQFLGDAKGSGDGNVDPPHRDEPSQDASDFGGGADADFGAAVDSDIPFNPTIDGWGL